MREVETVETLEWRKSSYSGYNGNCVEMACEMAWKKSSYSGANNCVEVGGQEGLVHVRDSKDPDSGKLTFSPADWNAFLATIKR
jgi:hypothetical protein